MKQFFKFNKRMDRRNPRDEGDFDSPFLRENLLCRDGKLKRISGTERATDETTLTDTPRWLGRYYTVEIGQVPAKTFCYTKDGKLWVLNDLNKTPTEVSAGLGFAQDAYPSHWTFKLGEQTYMYMVDGTSLFKYDGNNDNKWEKVTVEDTDGNSIKPIDVIEHKDRLWVISKYYLFISKNLEPDNFSDSSDAIQLVVGSGKGENVALGKLNDKLYIFTTEGIFVITGDTISALAPQFSVDMVDQRNCISRRTVKRVENSLVFLADDYNLWSFNGASSEKLTHPEKLEEFVNPHREALDKAVATYYDNYYMVSFVEGGQDLNKLEVFYDAIEQKCDFIRGRNVSCYLEIDPTKEITYQQVGRSEETLVMFTGRGHYFDKDTIVQRLWTKDITVSNGENVRFTAFYPKFEPVGDHDLTIWYFLDGRLSDEDIAAYWAQSLEGDTRRFGASQKGALIYSKVLMGNQSQATGRVRPKIGYSRGQSISFYINERTPSLHFSLTGIGIEFVGKAPKKGRKVGQ